MRRDGDDEMNDEIHHEYLHTRKPSLAAHAGDTRQLARTVHNACDGHHHGQRPAIAMVGDRRVSTFEAAGSAGRHPGGSLPGGH